ncbi:MAG: hypothetical protein AVDCRST_MAG15-1563, partial [uncultured Rubellimicrobium sp.]
PPPPASSGSWSLTTRSPPLSRRPMRATVTPTRPFGAVI